jgi:two-component system LytT family sensor kinase
MYVDEPPNTEMRLFLRSFLVSLASWTIVGVFFAINLFLYDRGNRNFLPRLHYVVWPALTVYSWAIVTPIAFAFCRKYPFDRSHWLKRGLQYLALAVALSYTQSALFGIGGWLYTHEMPLHRFLTHELLKSMQVTIETWVVLFSLVAYQRLRNEAKMRAVREAQLEARVASAELEMLRIQLQPHFLFNTLQAAAVLVHEDVGAAEDVLLRLSELLRVAFDDMSHQEVPLVEELAFLDLYLGIQKQRFRDRLTVHVNADAGVMFLRVPSLILQPLVENALHHGIGVHREHDTVEISVFERDDFLELEVRNFGSDLSSPSNHNGHGVGLRNTRARLEQLYGDAATLELRDLDPRGVAATIRIRREALR